MNQASPVAVVTGVGPGTGAAIVRRFARGGYAVAMLAGNAPMTALRLTDPRQWSAADWASDVVPHVAYGAVAAGVLAAADS